MSEFMWRLKEGRTVPISSLSDSHLNNAYRYLTRTIVRLVGDMRQAVEAVDSDQAEFGKEELSYFTWSTGKDLVQRNSEMIAVKKEMKFRGLEVK